MLSIACVAVVIFFSDSAPPDDTDLMPTRLDIPDEENAFTHLERARDILYWPSADDNRLRDTIEGFLPDFDLARDVIDRNAETFEHIDAALACKQCQVPEYDGPDTPLDYLTYWIRMWELYLLRAALLHHSGNEQAAFDQAMTALRLGHILETCRGGVCIHHFVGSAQKQAALACLRNMLPHTSLPREPLRRVSDELRNYYTDTEALAETYRAEYASACATVDAIKADTIDLGEDIQYKVFGHLLQPNRTKVLIAGFYREAMEYLNKPFASQPTRSLEEYLRNLPYPDFPGYLLQMNATGKLLAVDLTSSTRRIALLKSQKNVQIAATRLLMALRSYELATGKLPDSLGALVPDFIEAIPTDDCDGKPIRYSPRERTVHSPLRGQTRMGNMCYPIGGRSFNPSEWRTGPSEELKITFDNTNLKATWLEYARSDSRAALQAVIVPADGAAVTLTYDEAHVEDQQGFVHVPGAGVYLYDPEARAFRCLAEKVDAEIMTADGPDADDARRTYLRGLLEAAKNTPQQ